MSHRAELSAAAADRGDERGDGSRQGRGGSRSAGPAPLLSDGAENARAAARTDFLMEAGWRDARSTALAADASKRRYFRLKSDARDQTMVLMDAPPDQGEDVRPFAALTRLLLDRGLSAPEIHHADHDRGFLLLEDFGDDLFSRRLAATPKDEAWLYQTAIDALLTLHDAPPPRRAAGFGAEHDVAPYDWTTLRTEASLVTQWYLSAATGAPVASDVQGRFELALREICEDAGLLAQDEADAVLTLRDYHADNLVWLTKRRGPRKVGLLDYQDALAGHPAYDLVSLLEDARRDVPPGLAAAMLRRYCAARGVVGAARARFDAAYAALGAQRNIKILGVFTRLWRRDGTDRYLDLLPRVWCWLKRDLAHPALAPLRAWVETEAPAPTPEIIAAIRSRPSGPGGRSQPRRAAPTDAAQALDTAMVLGAGMGARMRPLTNTTPKPLIEIGGASLLEHTLKRAEESGVGRAVVNIHHLAPQMQRFASLWNERGRAPELTVSDETVKLMETGGGVVKALPLLKRDAFFVLNSDNLWTGAAPLGPLRAAWDPSRMDALLLLCPVGGAHGYTRRGDFSLDSEGRLVRRGERPQAPLVFTGAQILSKAALKGAPDEPFSLNVVWDALIAKGRAYGVLHLGEWADAGDIAKLKTAEAMLEGARKPLAPGVVWPLTPEAAYELDRRAAEAAAEAASDASLRDLERRARAAEIAAAREPEPEPDPAPAAAAPAARAFAAGAAASFAAKPAQPAPADEAAPAEAALTETAPAEEAAAEPPHYEPAITEPEPKEPSPHGQAAQGATFQDSALQDSALQDATLQDAALQDAALQDAALQDAAPEQEARRDAELEAASLEDPALEDHHVEDPAPDEAENTPAARFEDALADLPVDAAGAPTPDAAPRFEDVLAAHPEDRLAAPEEHPASPVAARRTQRGWEREAGSEPPLLLSNALLAEPPEHQPSGGGVGESAEDRLSAAEYDFEEADPYDDEAYIDEYDDVIDDEDLQDDAFDGAETMGRGDIAHQQETMGHQGRGDDGYDDDGDGFGSEAREAAFDGDDLSGLDLPDLPADEADLGGLDLPDLDSPGPAETPAWGAPEDRGARRRD